MVPRVNQQTTASWVQAATRDQRQRFQQLDQDDPAEIAGYVLRARLGAGGMGTVYLSATRGGLPVALKVVRRELVSDPEFRQRFRREVEAAQRVLSPFTAMVLDADPYADVPWLATAYVAGPSLQSAVQEHGRWPQLSVLHLLAATAEGIAAVHAAGLIHRDLKPANVLLAKDGPRVIDFGIAHPVGSSRLTSVGYAIGTPAFMAPEQIQGPAAEATAATDVWALGHLAVWAATGHPAFRDDSGSDSELRRRILSDQPDLGDCDAALRPIAERCLAKEPGDRPSVQEVAAAARDQLAGQTTRLADGSWLPGPVASGLAGYATAAAPPPSAWQAPPPVPGPRRGPLWPRRVPLLAVITAAALLLGLGGYVGYVIGNTGSPAAAPGRTVPDSPGSSATSSPTPAGARGTGSTTPNGYTLKYSDISFTLPGDGCQAVDIPAYATFTGSGPDITTAATSDGSSGGDLELNCYVNSSGYPGIDFNGHQAAEVTGTSGPSACELAITRDPLGGGIELTALSAGVQFCVRTASGLLALVSLTSADDTTDNLSWTVTAWSAPASR